MTTKESKPAPRVPAVKQAERKPDEWDTQARNLIKGVMVTRGFRFKTLAARLEELGHPITESALGLRVNRGSFNLGYALLMLRAMGETELSIKHIKLGAQWEKTSKLIGHRGRDVVIADLDE
jgi:hypothetical protein